MEIKDRIFREYQGRPTVAEIESRPLLNIKGHIKKNSMSTKTSQPTLALDEPTIRDVVGEMFRIYSIDQEPEIGSEHIDAMVWQMRKLQSHAPAKATAAVAVLAETINRIRAELDVSWIHTMPVRISGSHDFDVKITISRPPGSAFTKLLCMGPDCGIVELNLCEQHALSICQAIAEIHGLELQPIGGAE